MRKSACVAVLMAMAIVPGCDCGSGDATPPGLDAGAMDSGGGARDAGRDASVGIDAGVMPVDAGVMPVDAGVTPVDAGTDASSDIDASAAPDAALCGGPFPICTGVCALTPPVCEGGSYVCRGPGFEETETSCDGYDNDCDGTTDEGCATCTVDEAAVRANLYSIYDIDFDYACKTYLNSITSGPDFMKVVPAMGAGGTVAQYFGNANQDMGFALVDPDATRQRVVVTYECCAACGCTATDGLTFLYTCARGDPGCGCAAETNCPGFLDAPFLASVIEDTSLMTNGFQLATPTGLAIGPGGTFYVGNWRPLTCSTDPACTTCDPAHPTIDCSPTRQACCYSSALGRLARFTPPGVGIEPTWHVVQELPGEEIFGLASGRDGSVWVGTRVSATEGRLYRYDPVADTMTRIGTYGGAVYSVTQNRRNGDWYLELRASPKLVRLDEAGAPLMLPVGMPTDPPDDGVLQYGPDGRLYRLVGRVNLAAGLDVYTLP